jgi:Cys-rich protein (TIGR01571 family)
MGECMCGPCCCGGVFKSGGLHLHTCPNMFNVAMRTKLRTKYGIQGTICDDICCIWCCELCVATQMYRELKHQGALFK